MSNLLPAGPEGETEHSTWHLVGASRMEQKTLFLVKGRPGHINPTLPDATLYLSALTEESLDLQGSSGTYHMLFDFFFFFFL